MAKSLRNLLIALIGVSFWGVIYAASPKGLPSYLSGIQEGDLIFYKGLSSQVPAINEASGSSWSHVGVLFKDEKGDWVVWEAVQPVGVNPLESFVSRARQSKDRKDPLVAVYRLNRDKLKMSEEDFHQCLDKVKKRLKPHLGKDYNGRFLWNTTSLYCSQFVWEGFQACGINIGTLENTSDLNIGPKVKALFKKRVDAKTSGGKNATPQQVEEAFKQAYKGQKIVTPVSQLRDKKLSCIIGCDISDK